LPSIGPASLVIFPATIFNLYIHLHLTHDCFLSFCLASEVMAERILMNEFKALSKEKWVHIEVCQVISDGYTA
jgi:hypothetical protein